MFKIIFNIDSLKVSKSKITTQVFAEIYCEYNRNFYFPYEGWDDFLLTIATLWSSQIIKTIKDKESDFYFIDGSFFLNLLTTKIKNYN